MLHWTDVPVDKAKKKTSPAFTWKVMENVVDD
jgi:hypothetical protein